ncbi:unnamed protein product [Mytilus coruscus]|uniref:Uncharacterized protein n=1 Tax=Mytilus coruscus TaxID=42192 RepID=A0A6J8D224_MYTCO|nr:unnamed protein product [Mytilus coruscus]
MRNMAAALSAQETVENRFEDGELIGKKLDNLVNETEKISDIRTIRVNRTCQTFIPVIVWDDFESQNQLTFAVNNTGDDVKIHNDLLSGGKTYKRVESINACTYSTPSRLLVYHIGILSWNGTKTIASFLWKGVSGLYGYWRGGQKELDIIEII